MGPTQGQWPSPNTWRGPYQASPQVFPPGASAPGMVLETQSANSGIDLAETLARINLRIDQNEQKMQEHERKIQELEEKLNAPDGNKKRKTAASAVVHTLRVSIGYPL